MDVRKRMNKSITDKVVYHDTDVRFNRMGTCVSSKNDNVVADMNVNESPCSDGVDSMWSKTTPADMYSI